jgi:long-subunit fatty acid transport protein
MGVEYRFDEWSIGLSYAQARGQGARVAERDQNAVIGGFSYQISETVQVGFGGAWLRDRSGGLPRRETGYAAFTEVGVSF